MSAKKVKLLNQAGEELYPRTTMDNILTAVGSTVYANLVKLNGVGKIDAQYLPSYVDDVVELIAMQATAPATCAKDDLYFNTESAKIFVATAANTWSATGTDPEKGVIYLDLSNADSTSIWRWSGTQMIQIYQQYAVTSSVTSASDDTAVPTAKATYDIASAMAASAAVSPAGSAGVATALGGVYVGSNIDVNAGGTISVATGSIGTAGVVALASATDVTSTATNETTAVTPKGVATVLSNYQPKFTTSSNVTISDGTISVAAGDTASAGVVRLATTAEAATTSSGVAVTPAGLQSELADYQEKITTSSNITLAGGTISVATAGSTTLGLVAVDQSTTSGVKLALNGGTVSAQGVAATTGAAGVMRFATSAETSGGSAVDAAVKPGDLATVLGGYQVAFTNTTNITVDGASISVATAGVGATSKGVIAVDQTASNGAALSIDAGVVKVTMAAAATGTPGAVALASTADASSFTGTNTAVTPAGLGSALLYGVFYTTEGL